MKLTELLLQDVERESARSARVLEQVPEGRHDWKPHERSMIFGYLAMMVATIPTWYTMIIEQDSLDLAPKDGSGWKPDPLNTSAEYLAAHEKAVAGARAALGRTTDEHLMTPWRLLVSEQTVWEGPRFEMLRDTICHLVHHRGQMTVYLRLMGATVPALYGPSADDKRF